MHCALCEEQIEEYSREYNQLVLDDVRKVDICADCIHKFLSWQRAVFAQLFPTTFAKKRLKKRE